jgi:hypothetical protein
MLDYPSSKVLIYWCAIAVAIDCCDPTGDGWLND